MNLNKLNAVASYDTLGNTGILTKFYLWQILIHLQNNQRSYKLNIKTGFHFVMVQFNVNYYTLDVLPKH